MVCFSTPSYSKVTSFLGSAPAWQRKKEEESLPPFPRDAMELRLRNI